MTRSNRTQALYRAQQRANATGRVMYVYVRDTTNLDALRSNARHRTTQTRPVEDCYTVVPDESLW